MQYVVLKDINGHTSTMEVQDFKEQSAPYIRSLYGVDISAIVALRSIVGGEGAVTAEHIKQIAEKLQPKEGDKPAEVEPNNRAERRAQEAQERKSK